MRTVKQIALFLIVLASFGMGYKAVTGHLYNLSKPDRILILPDTLREISGLTHLDDSTFACIQDENGIIFIYDIVNNRIKKQFVFNINGDYEGITRVNTTLYILRSDGMLYEITDYRHPKFKLRSYATGIPANNNEGLCYDAVNEQLLIACKGKPAKGAEHKDKRFIYGFSLKTKTLTKDPVFDFNLQEIKQYAMDHNIAVPVKAKKKGKIIEPFIKFNTSAIGIHPIEQKLYLLSATDHLFFIFNMSGKLEYMELLNASVFNKAEGITFMSQGDMLITNEAKGKKATVLKFNYSHK